MKFIIDKNEIEDEHIIKISLKQDKNDVVILVTDTKTNFCTTLGCFSNGSLILFHGIDGFENLKADDKGYLVVKRLFLHKFLKEIV